jgi:hypothetical protein
MLFRSGEAELHRLRKSCIVREEVVTRKERNDGVCVKYENLQQSDRHRNAGSPIEGLGDYIPS